MSKRYIGGLISAFNNLKVANAPTIGTPIRGCSKVCVAFTAPSCVGGGAISNYTAVSNPCFITATGTTSPITVTGLTNGTAYTFTVNATNVYGPSAFSAASSSVTPLLAGTVALFAIGRSPCGNTATRNLYTFASNSSTTGTSASAASGQGSAAGNNNLAIFALGNNASTGTQTTTRNKYTYSSFANTSATASSIVGNSGSAAGNSTVGIFAIGGCTTATTRNKYIYSCDTSTSATASSQGSYGGSAAGNCTFGIFALGASFKCGICSASTVRNKYFYACNTNSTIVTASRNGSWYGSAAGTGTFGIFATGGNVVYCGNAQSARCKYVYSANTNVAATSATTCSYRGAAAGNNTVGIFQLGYSGSAFLTTRDKYTYSGCVVSSGAAASVGTSGGSAASNGTCGVNV